MRPHPDVADARRIMQRREKSIASGLGRRIRITVRGRLSDRLATAFEGMALVSRRDQTDLVGEVVDQAHLYGLLARIRDLGLELESVNSAPRDTMPRCDSDPDEQKEA